MLTPIEIGKRIEKARKACGFSQVQLAERLSISPQAVGKWERGESMPDIVTFDCLAEIFGIELNYFSAKHDASKDFNKTDTNNKEVAVEKKLGWNMSSARWLNTDFSGLRNLGEKFSGSQIMGCKFVGSDLAGIKLSGNHTRNNIFDDSNLRDCQLRSGHIRGNSFVNCSFNQATISWNHIVECNFMGADFSMATLRGNHVNKCNTQGAIWNKTNFRSGAFTEIVFEGMIVDCSFENCTLKKSHFSNAIIKNTFFKNTNLKKVRFENCSADSISYAFIKNSKADMNGILLLSNE